VSTLPDEALLSALAATGAPESLDELIDRYWGESYRVALRCLNDADAAAGLVHDLFAHLALGVPALSEGQTFRGWLHATLFRRLQLREKTAGGLSAVGAVTHAPEDALSLEELRRHLREVSLDARLALVLHLYEGCSAQEVGEALGCSASVARTRVQEGQRDLQAVLTEAGHGALGPSEIAELMRGAPKPVAPTAPAASTLVEEESAGPARAWALLVAAIAFAALLIGGALTVLTGEQEDPWAQPSPAGPTVPAVVLAPDSSPSPGADAGDVGGVEDGGNGADAGTDSPETSPSPEASAGDAVRCWLRHDDGQAAAGYVVYLQRLDASGSRSQRIRLEADSSGLGSLALDPGTYLVRALDSDMADVVGEIEVRPGAAPLEVVVPRLLPLRGLIADGSGVPIPDATVLLQVSPSAEARTGADGRFDLGEQPAGRLWLGARAKGFRGISREAIAHDGAEVRLTLAQGRELTVEGRLGPGVSVTGAVSYAVSIAGGTSRSGRAPVMEGRFTIKLVDLPPATTLALALKAGDETGPATFTLGSDQGQADLGDVAFPEGRTLRGQVVVPPGHAIGPGRGLALVEDGLFQPTCTIAADGAFELRGLAAEPADLILVVEPDDDLWGPFLQRRLPLDVAAIEGGDLGMVEVQLHEHDALRPAAPWDPRLRQAELDPEDLIVEVVEVAASTADALIKALAEAGAGAAPVRLGVLRGEARREVELSVSGLDEARLRALFAPASRP
jgi:DNA-directed RNA polymerase specialized sigma24 family protein